MHKTLTNWEARRSGAALSITGTDIDSGEKTKLTGILAIGSTFEAGRCKAMGADGISHQLVC